MDTKEIKETLEEMLPLIKEVLEMEEVKELLNLYIGTILKNKAIEEYNNRMIDQLASSIAYKTSCAKTVEKITSKW